VYELGAAEGTYYLSMEYVEGATIARILHDGPLAAELVAHLGAQVCDALDYAHGRFGILHRDITPRNIIVDSGGHARLLDFGIAGALGVVDLEVFGSPGYMAPEQARRKALTPAADVFSLGAVLYEAVTGREAFERTARGSLGPRPEFAQHDPVPPALARAIRDMLAPDPRDRPQGAAEVARQLRGFLASGHPEGVLAEMRERAEAARSRVSEKPVADEPKTAPVTERMAGEARPFATSSILTEMLRSAPGVALASSSGMALAPQPAPALVAAQAPATAHLPAEPGTRPIDRAELAGDEPRAADLTNPTATRFMLRAWPWLALLALLVAGLLARQKPAEPSEPTKPAPKPSLAEPPTKEPVEQAEPKPQATPEDQPKPQTAPQAEAEAAQAKPAPKPEGAESSGSALLSVNATPWAEVTIDRRPHGTTPLRNLKLRAGNHVLRFVCPPLGRDSEIEVQIAADARARIAVDLSYDPPRTFLDGVTKVR
jgi:serine/threonine-protein kinase